MRAGLLLFVGLAIAAFQPEEGAAQLSRDAPVQQGAGVRQGDLLVGAGASVARGARFPLSGLRGDLVSLGELRLAWGVADRAVIEMRWTAQRFLDVSGTGPAAILLDPSVADGTTSDVGDLRLGGLFLPLGGDAGWAVGARFEVRLPNTDETLGIGTNTFDVLFAAAGGYRAPAWRATGSLGVRILEAPLEDFRQNDVLDYALVAAWDLDRSWTLTADLEGTVHTASGSPPVGTEDRGRLGVGVRHALGGWSIDAGARLGLTEHAPDWSVRLGVALELAADSDGSQH